MDGLVTGALTVAAVGALARSAMVLMGAVRSFLIRARFARVRFGLAEAIVYPEPAILAAAAVLLLLNRPDGPVSALRGTAAIGGALVVLVAWAVTVWTFRSWPGLFAGHAIENDHALVTNGAYGWVRHPAYLAVLGFWFGLALAFSSPLAGAIALAYVLPAYLLYMKSEEKMMFEAFGREYSDYKTRVPMLVPRW